MIGKDYKAYRDNVVDIFKRYKEKKVTFENDHGESPDGVNLKYLEKRVESLENKEFKLAAAGEVKAGKSTLINALLGTEILPADILQTTSAVVEIFKSQSLSLRIKFADGKEELYGVQKNTNQEVVNRLHDFCKIHDEYRDIPTTLIDQFIIECDKELEVDDHLIGLLASRSKSKLNSLKDKQTKIKQYVSKRSKNKIPVKIELGYPMKWDFDELRIVDTPGVNAIGGIQDAAFSFLDEANAILFVHKIPLESESFKNFVEDIITERSKETLFLILTHASEYTSEEVEKYQAEARRIYKDEIDENRILVVDSMLKLIHCDIESGLDIREPKKKKLLSSCRDQAEEENRELRDVVLEASRFTEMLHEIGSFLVEAPKQELREILDKIISGYEQQEIEYKDKNERQRSKKRNPQEFEEEIDRIKKRLEEWKLSCNEYMEDLISKSSGVDSLWQKHIDTLKDKYNNFIMESSNHEKVRKNTVDGLNAVQEVMDGFSEQVKEEFRALLEDRGSEFTAEYRISIPKIDLEALKQKAEEEAYVTESQYETRTPWYAWPLFFILAPLWMEEQVCVGEENKFSKEKFLSNYKERCKSGFTKVINELPGKSQKLCIQYSDNFKKEMDLHITARQKALEIEKEKKQTNKDLISKIEEFDKKKKDIAQEKSKCIEVKENIV